VREIRPLRVMWRELETGLWSHLPVTAPVPDPTIGGGLTSGYELGRVKPFENVTQRGNHRLIQKVTGPLDNPV